MIAPMEHLLDLRRQAEERLLSEKLRMRIGITVGSATCENAAGAPAVFERLQQLMDQHHTSDVVLSRVGCTGRCDMEPVVTVRSKGAAAVKYVSVNPATALDIFESHVLKGVPVEKYSMPLSGEPCPECLEQTHWTSSRLANRFLPVYGDVDFFGKQFRLTLRNCGVIDPESLDEYLSSAATRPRPRC